VSSIALPHSRGAVQHCHRNSRDHFIVDDDLLVKASGAVPPTQLSAPSPEPATGTRQFLPIFDLTITTIKQHSAIAEKMYAASLSMK
jgi:hypothetical protein